VKEFFLKTERPENFECRSYPRQLTCLVNRLMVASQRVSDAGNSPVEKRKRRLKTIKTSPPAPDG
jgi:hypothetical protein